ncbi:MAG TPA: M28 family peptidase, partial [Symbiobacteriaceae bacterium]|nr:M28 family peptidase [Symbiobacteriaceae bacterium]
AGQIRGWMERMGYRVTLQEFRAPRDTLYLGPAMVLSGFVLAAAAGLWAPVLGLLLALAFLAPMVGDMLGSRTLDFDRLLPLYTSRNVVGWNRPAEPARRTLVISAHYDTQRASLLFHPKAAPYLQAYFTCVYALLGGVLVALLLRLIFSAPWTGTLLFSLAALLLPNIALLLYCRFTGRYINGANDNGSGVAMALSLAEKFARGGLAGTELFFVFTGAEEVGVRGMKHFLRQMSFDPATTRFINVDNVGGGKLHYLQGEGMLAVKPYSAELLDLAVRMAGDYPGQVAPKANLLLPTDGLVPSAHGYHAISFLAFREDGSLPDYHWYTDTLERVDRELIGFVEEFLGRYVERVAEVPSTMGA